jgi:hypothetical protein
MESNRLKADGQYRLKRKVWLWKKESEEEGRCREEER